MSCGDSGSRDLYEAWQSRQEPAPARASWLTPHLAAAIEAVPVPVDEFWRVQAEYTWITPDGDSGSGRVAFPSFGSLQAARESLARLQAAPDALASASHPERTYTATAWQVLRFETWSLIFEEPQP